MREDLKKELMFDEDGFSNETEADIVQIYLFLCELDQLKEEFSNLQAKKDFLKEAMNKTGLKAENKEITKEVKEIEITLNQVRRRMNRLCGKINMDSNKQINVLKEKRGEIYSNCVKNLQKCQKTAKHTLILYNEPLIKKFTESYKYENLDYDEMKSECQLGLIDAASKYDPEHFNVEFSTYSKKFIVGKAKEFIYHNRTLLHVSKKEMCIENKIREAESDLSEVLNRNPTLEELQDFLCKQYSNDSSTISKALSKITKEDLNLYLSMDLNTVSLNQIVADGTSSLEDFIESKNDSTEEILYNKIHDIIDITLKQNEKKVVDYIFFPSESRKSKYEEIELLNKTESEVNDIWLTAKRKLARNEELKLIFTNLYQSQY